MGGLVPTGDGKNLKDPNKPDDGVDVQVFKGSTAERHLWPPTRWFFRAEYVVEQREYNKFQEETVEWHYTRHERTNTPPREATDGKGLCWTECEMKDFQCVRTRTLTTRYYEIWTVNKTLGAYYDFVTGAGIGIPAGVGGVAGATAKGAVAQETVAGAATRMVVTQAAGKSLPGAGTALGEAVGGVVSSPVFVGAATFVTAFTTTTYVMRKWGIEDQEQTSSGWELVQPIPDWGPETVLRESHEYWAECGPKHPCPPKTAMRTATGVGIGLGAAALVTVAAGAAAVGSDHGMTPSSGGTVAITSSAPTSEPTQPPTLAPTPTPPLLTGHYMGSISVLSDPFGHSQFIGPMPMALDVMASRNLTTNVVTVQVNGAAPFIPITSTGNYDVTSGSFAGMGAGTVTSNQIPVQASLQGTLLPGHLTGDLTFTGTPNGPISYHIDMTKSG